MRRFFSSFLIICAVFSLVIGVGVSPALAQQPSGVTFDADKERFDSVNPLQIGGGNQLFDSQGAVGATVSKIFPDGKRTPADIIAVVWMFAFPIAGLILFAMLVWGGFEMVVGAAESKSKDQGRQRATAAVVGFILLFSAYWITQIIQYIFGVKILN